MDDGTPCDFFLGLWISAQADPAEVDGILAGARAAFFRAFDGDAPLHALRLEPFRVGPAVGSCEALPEGFRSFVAHAWGKPSSREARPVRSFQRFLMAQTLLSDGATVNAPLTLSAGTALVYASWPPLGLWGDALAGYCDVARGHMETLTALGMGGGTVTHLSNFLALKTARKGRGLSARASQRKAVAFLAEAAVETLSNNVQRLGPAEQLAWRRVQKQRALERALQHAPARRAPGRL